MPDPVLSSPLSVLRQAKAESDRRNYAAKRQLLRQLLGRDPAAFRVDQPQGKYPGITHTGTGYRLHTDRETARLARG